MDWKIHEFRYFRIFRFEPLSWFTKKHNLGKLEKQKCLKARIITGYDGTKQNFMQFSSDRNHRIIWIQSNFIFRRSEQLNIASVLKISAKKAANQKHNKQIDEQLKMQEP